MDRHRLAVIIPAFNEEKTIAQVVSSVAEYGTPVVVDDASTDSTAAAADAAGAIVVSHGKNSGYDAALNSGFAAASEHGFDYAVTMDADGQHNPAIIERYAGLLESNADLVVGIRPARARLAEKLFCILSDFMYGISDPMCGMKGYRMALYRELGHFDSYGSIGSELTLFAAKRGYRIIQTHIPITPRHAGASRFGRLLSANLRILRGAAIGAVKYAGFRRPKAPVADA
jgi:glycosyltransferase involved in cell wall biosynthesis